MASIIPGFEYDIFISYRHNDNYAGWVTEFVTRLQEDLAAALKDHISVYFDTNLPDGLLETHDVDKSVEGKLKCLILMPIISQTYCDPKSFAWQHEFTAFNEMAQQDEFGRDIRLASGNIASRILPVQIHDLDEEDKLLLNNNLGGELRSIEFIYKSAGVNRPLSSMEDHPKDNVNKTYYRDQINKVANAAKEIISALKAQQDRLFEEKVTQTGQIAEIINGKGRKRIGQSIKLTRSTLVTGSFILAFLFVILIGYPRIYKNLPINETSAQVLEKAISCCDFFHKWDDYHGKISLRTVWENGTHSDEIIEIQTKEGFYQSNYTSGEVKYTKGIINGRCIQEINGDKNPGEELIKKYALDCDRIKYIKELHYCHFGLLMELKKSGLLLQKKVDMVKFNGNNCLSLIFTSDTVKVESSYFRGLNFIVYLDPADYSLKGVRWYGRINAYILFSGILNVNGIKMPLCKTYFSSEDNSVKFIDLFTLAN